MPSRNRRPEPRPAISPKKATEILHKLIADSRTLPGEGWDSPKREGWKSTARIALERAGVSDSLLNDFDQYDAFSMSSSTTNEELRQMVNSSLNGRVAVLQAAINALAWESETEESTQVTVPKATISIFISHSSIDKTIASALIEVLRNGLGLRAEDIRCSSLDGYRLPGGANTEAQLRNEVNTAKAFVGLITANSLSSAYVMFELGARWGVGLHMLPLLAGVDLSYIKGPLTGINALSCSSEAQVFQMVEELGQVLKVQVESPTAIISYVKKLIDACK